MTDHRFLSDTFAVSPQISLADLDEIKAAGFDTVLCNRPDREVPIHQQAVAVRAACEGLGLKFIENPLSHGSLTLDHVERQREAADSGEKVFAYCASGNRSSILWSLAMAGTLPTDDIVQRAAQAGFDLRGLAPQIDALARQKG